MQEKEKTSSLHSEVIVWFCLKVSVLSRRESNHTIPFQRLYYMLSIHSHKNSKRNGISTKRSHLCLSQATDCFWAADTGSPLQSSTTYGCRLNSWTPLPHLKIPFPHFFISEPLTQPPKSKAESISQILMMPFRPRKLKKCISPHGLLYFPPRFIIKSPKLRSPYPWQTKWQLHIVGTIISIL